MPQLSKETISSLEKLLATAQLANVARMIIEPTKIRAIDDTNSVVIVSETNVPDFHGMTVGLLAPQVLQQRLALFKNADITVEATEAKREGEISHLSISSKKSSVQYRCAALDIVQKVPKNINDTVMWSVNVAQTDVASLVQANGVMGADLITITYRNGVLKAELIDTNRDVFSTDLSDNVTSEEDASDSFHFNYTAKTLLPLLKAAALKNEEGAHLSFGEAGILVIAVNDIPVSLIPRDE